MWEMETRIVSITSSSSPAGSSDAYAGRIGRVCERVPALHQPARDPIGGTVVGGVLTAPSPLGVTQPFRDDDTTVARDIRVPRSWAPGGRRRRSERAQSRGRFRHRAQPCCRRSCARGARTQRRIRSSSLAGRGAAELRVERVLLELERQHHVRSRRHQQHTDRAQQFRQGLPMMAPAWADLNPAARAVNLARSQCRR